MTDAFAAWIERDVVAVSGPDAAAYLHGQLSQDIDGLTPGDSRWSLLLSPAGKVDAWVRVHRARDEVFVLDVDGGWGAATLERLNRFKLRTKVDIEIVAGWRCLAVRGAVLDSPAARPIVWPGTEGVDLLGPDVELPLGIPLTDEYERARIEAGVPAMGRELTDATIPVEGGQWLIEASVSFTKGCYTGQELVARVDARGGNAPRPIRGVWVAGRADVDDEVAAADGRTAGHLTSVWFDPARDETIALAPLARALEPPAAVTVGGREARVVALPMR